MKRWSKSSLQVIDPKASAAPSWSGMMSATTARPPCAERSARRAVYAECMLTAVPSDRPSDRLSTMVPDDILSTTHVSRSGDDDRCCTSMRCMCSKLVDTRKQLNPAGYRRSCSSPRMAMVLERIVELSHAIMNTNNGQLWLLPAYFRRP